MLCTNLYTSAMTTPSARVAPAELTDFAAAVLVAHGVRGDQASLIADSLVAADLWGHQSHGLLRLPWYCARLASGAMKDVDPQTVVDAGALLVLDARDGIGQVATDVARALGVARAKEHGVAVVGVRNSGHFGTAMYYTRRAAQEGCVAILTTNASPAMAPWGGMVKTIGTNPWSIAAPGPDGDVLALDIANTAVARGKIYLARSRGEGIPDGWAMDADGHPTNDAQAGIDGIIMPMAGHKGYAISFMMDVISGALTGSGTGTQVHGPYEPTGPSRAGHLLVVIDVAAMGDPQEYRARVRSLVDEVHGCPTAPGFEEVVAPGELETRSEADNRAAGGVVLPDQTLQELAALAASVNVSVPFDAPADLA